MARKQTHKPYKYYFVCECGEAEDGFAYEIPWGRAEAFEKRHLNHETHIFCPKWTRTSYCVLWRGHEPPCESLGKA